MSFEIAPVVGQVACARMLLNIQDVMRITLPDPDPYPHSSEHYSMETRRSSAVPRTPRRTSFPMSPPSFRQRHGVVTDTSLDTVGTETDISNAFPDLTSGRSKVHYLNPDGTYEPTGSSLTLRSDLPAEP